MTLGVPDTVVGGKLRMMQNPRRLRRLLRFVESLPRRIRPNINPALSLAATSLGRANQIN